MFTRIHTVEQVKAVLLSYEKLKAVVEGGGSFTSFSELLLDVDRLTKECKFSKRQKEIIKLYYLNGYNQTEVARLLNISQQGVCFHLGTIDVKIHETLKKWKARGY